MSKCGMCGEDFGSGSHMVMECRANMIPKRLYDRMCVGMANEENPEDFYESFEDEDPHPQDSVRQQRIEEMAEVWQTEEAMDIMYELTQIYQRRE